MGTAVRTKSAHNTKKKPLVQRKNKNTFENHEHENY